MARYHFNIINGTAERDIDGTECPTVAHARREAVRQMGMRLITRSEEFWDGRTWRMEAIRVGQGAVFELSFCAASIVPDEWLD